MAEQVAIEEGLFTHGLLTTLNFLAPNVRTVAQSSSRCNQAAQDVPLMIRNPKN